MEPGVYEIGYYVMVAAVQISLPFWVETDIISSTPSVANVAGSHKAFNFTANAPTGRMFLSSNTITDRISAATTISFNVMLSGIGIIALSDATIIVKKIG
jgi:hypothetical protein